MPLGTSRSHVRALEALGRHAPSHQQLNRHLAPQDVPACLWSPSIPGQGRGVRQNRSMGLAQVSRGVGDVVDALASVAIACLVGGPLAGGQKLLDEAIPIVHQHVRAHMATKALQRELKTALEDWARREAVNESELGAGFTTALHIVAAAGLDAGDIAAFHYDPKEIADELVQRARSLDSFDAEDPLYTVAARVVEATYSNLIREYHDREPILIPVLRSLRTDLEVQLAAMANALERLVSDIDDTRNSVREVHDSIASQASREDYLTYLRIRLVDWDRHLWLPSNQMMSSLERGLRVRPSKPNTRSSYKDLDTQINRQDAAFGADDLAQAFAGKRLLMVLGGPGSGKSWLVRRYARRAARAAIEQLEQGAPLEQVEIPILTTWEAWTRSPDGDDRESLVKAAFSAGLGHSDLGGSSITDRLKRALGIRTVAVLAVIDSLDEAADKASASTRLQSLASIGGWRAIVSSRPSAWQNTQLPSDQTARLVELLELDYPSDVEGFIDTWFNDTPAKADQLKQQISASSELRDSARVPLLLTFYCILTTDGSHPGSGLPAKRRDLYQEVVEHLIESRWRNSALGPDNRASLEDCHERLRSWAWDSVRNSVELHWSSTFTPDNDATDVIALSIKAIVPRTGNRRERQFIHRTIQEYLVAEYVARLPANQAFDILKSHLYLNDDWQAVVPTAIAAHHLEYPGELLALVEKAMDYQLGTQDKWRGERLSCAARLLARVADEFNGNLWTNCPPSVENWRLRLLEMHLGANGWLGASERLWVISRLGASADQLDDAMNFMVAGLKYPDNELKSADAIAETLLKFNASPAHVIKVTDWIVDNLARAAAHTLGSLFAPPAAGALLKLGASPEQLDRLVETRRTNAGYDWTWILPELGASSSQLDRTRLYTAIASLTSASGAESSQVEVVLELAKSSDVLKTRALCRIAEVLPSARSESLLQLARVMSELNAPLGQQGLLVERLLATAPKDESSAANQVAELLSELVGSSDELRERGEAELVRLLESTGPNSIRPLIGVALALIAASDDLRHSVVNALSWANLANVGGLAATFSDLDLSTEERGRAIDEVLNVLPMKDPGDTFNAIVSLRDLEMSVEQLERLTEIVLDVIPSTPPWLGSMVGSQLPRLGASIEQCEQVAHALLDRVRDLGLSYQRPVFRALKSLAPTDIWQSWVNDNGFSVEEANAVTRF